MAVVSVRVDDKVKMRLKEAGIDVPLEVKRYLEELAWRVELKGRLERLGHHEKTVGLELLGRSREIFSPVTYVIKDGGCSLQDILDRIWACHRFD